MVVALKLKQPNQCIIPPPHVVPTYRPQMDLPGPPSVMDPAIAGVLVGAVLGAAAFAAGAVFAVRLATAYAPRAVVPVRPVAVKDCGVEGAMGPGASTGAVEGGAWGRPLPRRRTSSAGEMKLSVSFAEDEEGDGRADPVASRILPR